MFSSITFQKNHLLARTRAFNNDLNSDLRRLENSQSSKDRDALIETIFKRLRHALETHRLNMLDLELFNKMFHFAAIKQREIVDNIEDLSIIEMFIKCQMEARMSWIYTLDEDIIENFTPQERITIREVNRSCSFFDKLSKDLPPEFPVNFLKNNFNTNFFRKGEATSFRIIKVGFKMIMCYLRCGFYTYPDLNNLINFVRQKYRFLKTWKDQSWEDEGQLFIIKFVKQCLFLLIDNAYESLMKNPDKLEGFILDDEQFVDNESKDVFKNEEPTFEDNQDTNRTNEESPAPGQKKRKNRRILGNLNSAHDHKTKELHVKHGTTHTDQSEDQCPMNYTLSDDCHYTLEDMMRLIRTFCPQEKRIFEDNINLLQEIFSNSILGWAANSTMPDRFPAVDQDIIQISEYFFNINWVVRNFEIKYKIINEEELKLHSQINTSLIEIDHLIAEVRDPRTDLITPNYLKKIISVLKELSSQTYNKYYQVHLTLAIKNVIELLVSITEYFLSPEATQRRSSIRRQTNSKLVIKRPSSLLKKVLSPNLNAKTLMQETSDIAKSDEWRSIMQHIIKLVLGSRLVYEAVANDYCLWHLVKISPRLSFKYIVNLDKHMLERDCEAILGLISEIYLENQINNMPEENLHNVSWGMVFGIEILRRIVIEKRSKSAFEFQFEVKVFQFAFRLYIETNLEGHLEHLLAGKEKFDFSAIDESQIYQTEGDLEDIGNMVCKGLVESSEFSHSNTVQSLLLYKVFEIMELCSQRFYCENFLPRGEHEMSIKSFRKHLLMWTYLPKEKKKEIDFSQLFESGNHSDTISNRQAKLLQLLSSRKKIPILVMILKLQTNLFLKAPNSILDNFGFDLLLASKDQLYIVDKYSVLDVVKNNYQIVKDKIYEKMKMKSKDNKAYLSIVKAVVEQLVIILATIDVMRENYDKDSIETYDEVLYMLQNLESLIFKDIPQIERLLVGDIDFITEKGQKDLIKKIEEKTAKALEFVSKLNIDLNIEELKRNNIYYDEMNLKVFTEMTRHSSKYVKIFKNDDHDFYDNLRKGNAFETDLPVLLKGLANIFVRVFSGLINGREIGDNELDNSVLISSSILRDNQKETFDRQALKLNWIDATACYFFFNHFYVRCLVFFEKICFEFKDFKHQLAKLFIQQNQRHHGGLDTFESNLGRKPLRAFRNIFDFSMRIQKIIERSIFQGSDWTILFGTHFLTMSILQSLNEQEFSFFQKLYGELFYRHSDMNEPQEIGNSYLTTAVKDWTKVMRKMKFDKMIIQKDTIKQYSPPFKNNYPVLKIMIDFFTSCIGNGNSNENIIAGVLINNLLNFLLFRVEDLDEEMLSLKYATSKLIDQILKKENSSDAILLLNQNGMELKIIYDYTIHFTKLQLIEIIENQNLEVSQMIHYKKKQFFMDRGASKRDSLVRGRTKMNSLSRLQSNIKSKTLTRRQTSSRQIKLLSKRKKNFSTISKKLFEIQSLVTINKNKRSSSMEIDLERTFITDLSLMVFAYSLSTSENIGFHFITSLLNIMTHFEKNHGGKYWMLRKQEADRYFRKSTNDFINITKDVKEEMAIVSFLTQINREIEIVDSNGRNKIILFQKFPELVNIREFVINDFFEDFDGDMILHKLLHFIPQILIQVKYYHSFSLRNPFLFKITTDNALWNYRAIIWAISVLLNILCLQSYIHVSDVNPIDTESSSEKYVINTIALFIGILALGQSILWLYTKYKIIEQVNIEKFKIMHRSINPSSLFSYVYIRVFKSILFQETIISVLLHVVFSLFGVFYSRVFHALHLLMFIFISKSIQRVLYAIVKNIKEMVLIFVFAVFLIYIYSIITLINYSDGFRTDETRGLDICRTLWGCFFNILDLGLRNGGGIAESMSILYTTHYRFIPKILFDISFFILINVIALNMVFGIIIDTFSEMRESNENKSMV